MIVDNLKLILIGSPELAVQNRNGILLLISTVYCEVFCRPVPLCDLVSELIVNLYR